MEKVRAGFAAHNRGDLDAWPDLYDREVEFETLSWTPTRARRPCARSTTRISKLVWLHCDPRRADRRWRQGDHGGPVGGAGTASRIPLDDQIASIQTFKNGSAGREQTSETVRKPSKPPGFGVGDVGGERGGHQGSVRGMEPG